jgi:hypothetical protein
MRQTVPMPNRRPQLELPKPVDTRLRRESPFRPAPTASPEEAAAIVAALERFMRDTAPTPAPQASPPDPWRRAALLEGIERKPETADMENT